MQVELSPENEKLIKAQMKLAMASDPTYSTSPTRIANFYISVGLSIDHESLAEQIAKIKKKP